MFKKIAALGAAAVLGIGLLTGCGASASTADAGYSAENRIRWFLRWPTACRRPTLSISP